jgi:RsiW-degrading membrane proteinase PrsW (M82 family)
MPLLSKPSNAAKAAVKFITIGALIAVWSGIWFYYMNKHSPSSDLAWYFCLGFMLTGLVLLVIGLAIGQIGRAARNAELPPPEVVDAVASAEVTGAIRAPIVTSVAQATPIDGSAIPVNSVRPR